MIEAVAKAIGPLIEGDNAIYWASEYGRPIPRDSVIAIAIAAIEAIREPTHGITRAMAESRATDDEGQFEPLMDLIDFSGENKAHTVLAQAWRDGIDAILKDTE